MCQENYNALGWQHEAQPHSCLCYLVDKTEWLGGHGVYCRAIKTFVIAKVRMPVLTCLGFLCHDAMIPQLRGTDVCERVLKVWVTVSHRGQTSDPLIGPCGAFSHLLPKTHTWYFHQTNCLCSYARCAQCRKGRICVSWRLYRFGHSSGETISLCNGLVTWVYNWGRSISKESTVPIVVAVLSVLPLKLWTTLCGCVFFRIFTCQIFLIIPSTWTAWVGTNMSDRCTRSYRWVLSSRLNK